MIEARISLYRRRAKQGIAAAVDVTKPPSHLDRAAEGPEAEKPPALSNEYTRIAAGSNLEPEPAGEMEPLTALDRPADAVIFHSSASARDISPHGADRRDGKL
jgi:hypothetical protein